MKIVMVAALFIAIFSNAGFGEEQLRSRPPSGPEVKTAIDSLAPDEKKVLSQARKEVFPVFVFIPGILGSKLTRIEGEKKNVIWGEMNFSDLITGPNAALAYKDTDRILAEPLNKFYVSGYGRDIYGKAYEALKVMNTGNSDNVLWFPYDWRQSNKKTASDLSAWLCSPEQQSKIRGNKVVFIAHSMGGLVLKYWLKHLYEASGCSGDKFSDWLVVRKVVFAGTPNFGAAKAALAFAEGFTLLIDPTDKSTVWKELAKVDAATLSKGLNKYGVNFPSAYELLPIINRPGECLQLPNDLTSVELQPQVGVTRPIDLFSVATWRQIGWPTQLKGAERDEFLDSKLPTLLSSAREFLCDVGSYRPEKRFEVLRFVGNKTPTICKITLNQPSEPGGRFTVALNAPCPGDGTVPAWTAKEQDRSSSELNRPTGESHDKLLSDIDFLGYLDDFYRDLMNELLRTAAKGDDEDQSATTNMFSKLKYVPPAPANKAGDDPATKSVATKVVQRLNITPENIYNGARGKKGTQKATSTSRAVSYRVFADIPGGDPEKRAWALNNSASIYLAKRNFAKAESLGKRALDVAGQIPETTNPKKVLDLKSKASLTVAIAAKQLGHQADALKYRDLAIKFGNPKAKRVSI